MVSKTAKFRLSWRPLQRSTQLCEMSYWLPEGLLKHFNLCLSALQQESSWSLRKCDLRDVSWMGDNFAPEEAECRAEHRLRYLLAWSSERWLLWVTPEVIVPHRRLQKGGESSDSAALLRSPGHLYKEEDWDDRPHRKVQLVRYRHVVFFSDSSSQRGREHQMCAKHKSLQLFAGVSESSGRYGCHTMSCKAVVRGFCTQLLGISQT